MMIKLIRIKSNFEVWDLRHKLWYHNCMLSPCTRLSRRIVFFCVKTTSRPTAAFFLSTQFQYIVHMPVSDARERIALKPCYISFHIAFMFDSLRKNLLHFRWISICFMIAKNACYICILYHAYSLRILGTLSLIAFGRSVLLHS